MAGANWSSTTPTSPLVPRPGCPGRGPLARQLVQVDLGGRPRGVVIRAIPALARAPDPVPIIANALLVVASAGLHGSPMAAPAPLVGQQLPLKLPVLLLLQLLAELIDKGSEPVTRPSRAIMTRPMSRPEICPGACLRSWLWDQPMVYCRLKQQQTITA